MTMIVGNAVAGSGAAGYQIQRSLRFNSADSAYLNRTPASAGNLRTWTWSAWVKRSKLGDSVVRLFNANDSGSPFLQTSLRFDTDQLRFYNDANSTADVKSSAVYRDASAWYHIVCAIDTTQATAANRVKLYVNGSQVTALATATYPNQNTDMYINAARVHQIGSSITPSQFFDGYMTEVNFIDGQALTPSDFGETDSATGVWKPKKFSGTYGTNGFYLNFSDNSNTTAATLGKDYSGNGNNWTPNNFSVTAGTGNDSLVDTPTSYGTDTGVGGEVRGNYCTLNPLDISGTLANGNLDYTGPTASASVRATFGMTSGKWYWENIVTSTSIGFGIAKSSAALTTYTGGDANGWGYYGDGQKYTNNSGSAYGSTFTTNDIIGVAFDADAGSLYFYKNGVVQNSGTAAFTGLTSGPYFPGIGDGASGSAQTATANFGQRPFAYTAPSGFKALCTQNLPTPTIGATSTTQANDYFNIVLYTGNGGTSQSITGVGFQPDFVWIKKRSGAEQHELQDAVRGATKRLASNLTDAETTVSSSIVSFNSNGFTVGNAGSTGENGFTYVGWNWNAGGSNATNTSGTITSTVRASTTAGFSIVTYTGNGTGGATVGHGLGVSPSWIIIKSRSNATNWMVWTDKLTTNYAFEGLNTTGAEVSGGSPSKYIRAVSSTTFTIGNDISVNQSASYTYVAYCFAAVAGYSAFGSYTGNGSTSGPFIYTGFRPALIMMKASGAAGAWTIFDSKRNPSNGATFVLQPNSNAAEGTFTSSEAPDLLSNGFRLNFSYADYNSNGVAYIYAAFAESPFKYSLAR